MDTQPLLASNASPRDSGGAHGPSDPADGAAPGLARGPRRPGRRSRPPSIPSACSTGSRRRVAGIRGGEQKGRRGVAAGDRGAPAWRWPLRCLPGPVWGSGGQPRGGRCDKAVAADPLSCVPVRVPTPVPPTPHRPHGFFPWPVFVTPCLPGAGPVQPSVPSQASPGVSVFSGTCLQLCASVGKIRSLLLTCPPRASGLFCHRPRAATACLPPPSRGRPLVTPWARLRERPRMSHARTPGPPRGHPASRTASR